MQVNIDTNQSYTGKYWCGLLGHDRCFSDQLILSPTPGFKFFLLVQMINRKTRIDYLLR